MPECRQCVSVCSHTRNRDVIVKTEIRIQQQGLEIARRSDQHHFVHFCLKRSIVRRQCHVTEVALTPQVIQRRQ